MKTYFLFICAICCYLTGNAHSTEYNIFQFGASKDTSVVQTQAINAAIENCHRQGGGKVIIPSGIYKSGTIFLKDNVELHLESGAYLYASDNYDDFPVQPQASYRSQKDAGGWVSLIYAVDAKNISITGKGTIDGKGKGRKGRISGLGGDRNGRPRNILFISCKDVHVEGITMRNSALWNQHYLNCEDVTIDHIKVYNHSNGNNDGIDIDGCRRFILSNSIIDSDDDGIVLKSTGTAPCENVIISNCIVSSFANAIKCGTESTGGFNMHNLFGDTNAVHVSVNEKGYTIEQVIDGETVAEVLDYVQYSPKKLVRTLETWVTQSVKEGRISLEEGKEFLSNYRSGLYGYTYLE